MTAAAFHDERAPYSVARLAERWECSERLIYKLIERGDLQCFRPGSLIRISAAEVERFANLRPLPPEGASPSCTWRTSVAIERTKPAPDALCSRSVPARGSLRTFGPCLVMENVNG